MMLTEYANDYDQLKDALLKLSADGFKRRFRSAKPWNMYNGYKLFSLSFKFEL